MKHTNPQHPENSRQDWNFVGDLKRWIEGLRLAAEAGEDVTFG